MERGTLVDGSNAVVRVRQRPKSGETRGDGFTAVIIACRRPKVGEHWDDGPLKSLEGSTPFHSSLPCMCAVCIDSFPLHYNIHSICVCSTLPSFQFIYHWCLYHLLLQNSPWKKHEYHSQFAVNRSHSDNSGDYIQMRVVTAYTWSGAPPGSLGNERWSGESGDTTLGDIEESPSWNSGSPSSAGQPDWYKIYCKVFR